MWRIDLPERRWWDEDSMILYSCFHCLNYYVTNATGWPYPNAEGKYGGMKEFEEFTDELINTKDDPSGADDILIKQGKSQAEILALWKWWNVERPAAHAAYDAELTTLYGGSNRVFTISEDGVFRAAPVSDEIRARREAHWKLEADLQAKDQEMLHRLIDVRPSLWT